MDTVLQSRAEQLTTEFASQAAVRDARRAVSSQPSKPAIALVTVPPFGQQPFHAPRSVCAGRLRDDREWFVQTLVEIRLQDGIVTPASDDLPPLTEFDQSKESSLHGMAVEP